MHFFNEKGLFPSGMTPFARYSGVISDYNLRPFCLLFGNYSSGNGRISDEILVNISE